MKNKIFNLIQYLTLTIIFTIAISSNNIYGQSWNALSSGTNGTVYASLPVGNQLIIAGDFTTAGGVTVNRIARWNGSSWSSIGTGMNGPVYALAFYNNQLIAGGNFTTAGGNSAYNIARWTGSTWEPLSLGTNGTVYALALAYSSYLFVGGSFTTAGGVTCNRIARWNGSVWSSVSNGTNDVVYSLAEYSGQLYAGGRFTQAGYYTINRIARIYQYGNYYYFYSLGSGMDSGSVNALHVYNSELIAGGSFTHIGGVPVNFISRWNGSNWSPMGSGLNNSAFALGTFSNELIIGGLFTSAGGTGASRIAKWNGSAWSSLGSGVSGGVPSVNAITTWAVVMYASGNFTSAGGTSANNIAGWGSLPVAPTLISPPDGALDVSLTPTLDWSDVANAYSYGAQVSLNPNFTSYVVNVSGLTSSQYTVQTTLSNYTVYFWRANAVNGLGLSPWSLIRWFRTLAVGIINTQEIPLSFKLYQNYPNPFNPSTTIKFDLPASVTNDILKISLYDITGKEVEIILNTQYHAGKWEMTYDASKLTSGIYFYRIDAGKYQATKKMILIK